MKAGAKSPRMLLDAPRDPRQQIPTSVRRLRPRDFKRLVRDLDRLIHRLRITQRNLRNLLAGVGIDDCLGATRLAPVQIGRAS